MQAHVSYCLFEARVVALGKGTWRRDWREDATGITMRSLGFGHGWFVDGLHLEIRLELRKARCSDLVLKLRGLMLVRYAMENKRRFLFIFIIFYSNHRCSRFSGRDPHWPPLHQSDMALHHFLFVFTALPFLRLALPASDRSSKAVGCRFTLYSRGPLISNPSCWDVAACVRICILLYIYFIHIQ